MGRKLSSGKENIIKYEKLQASIFEYATTYNLHDIVVNMLNNAFCEGSTNPVLSMAEYLLKQCNKDVKTLQEDEIAKLRSKLAALTLHLESVVEANDKLKEKDEAWVRLFKKEQEARQLAKHPSPRQLYDQPTQMHCPNTPVIGSSPYNENSQLIAQNSRIPSSTSSVPPSNSMQQLRKKKVSSSSHNENVIKKKNQTDEIAQKDSLEDAQELDKQVAQPSAIIFDSPGPPTTSVSKSSSTCNEQEQPKKSYEAMEDLDDSSSESGLIIDTQENSENVFEISKKIEEEFDKAFSNMPLLTNEDLTRNLIEDSAQINSCNAKPLEMLENIPKAVKKVDSAEITVARSMSSGFFDYDPKTSADVEDFQGSEEQHPAKKVKIDEIEFLKKAIYDEFYPVAGEDKSSA